jgi:hypothetical protein
MNSASVQYLIKSSLSSKVLQRKYIKYARHFFSVFAKSFPARIGTSFPAWGGRGRVKKLDEKTTAKKSTNKLSPYSHVKMFKSGFPLKKKILTIIML